MLNFTPARSIAVMMASQSCRVSAIGFCSRTALPASAAAITCWACWLVGLVTKTASISSRAISRSRSGSHSSPYSAAAALAALGIMVPGGYDFGIVEIGDDAAVAVDMPVREADDAEANLGFDGAHSFVLSGLSPNVTVRIG